MSVNDQAAVFAGLAKRIAALERAASGNATVAERAQTGDIKASIATSIDGWLHLDGSAVLNADTTHPDLWAIAPASWKSGTTLNLPNMDERVLQGETTGTLGELAGANTHTLAEANLPSHTHDTSGLSTDIDHDHGSVTSGNQSQSHTHSANPPVTPMQRANDNSGTLPLIMVHTDEGRGSVTIGTTGQTRYWTQPNDWEVDIQAFNTGNQSQSHTHSVDLPNYNVANRALQGTLGSTGSGTAVDHTPAHMTVRFFVKT